ncbi:MAG: hypothetical protein Q4F83_10915 [Eubacteriales bacterium]|nr:hypothetical protein [Eubacteriales bacterium]
MKPIEIKVLRYIYKETKLPVSEIYSHFLKYDKTLIDGVLFLLESNDYIRTKNKIVTITDRGQIEAASAQIINTEKWKDRIIGFVFGIVSTVLSGLLLNALIQYF